MNREQSLHFRLEIIWWIFTLILAAGILYPILREVDDYPFLVINIIFVIVFVTFTRYIFLLKHTFLAKQQLIKSRDCIDQHSNYFYVGQSNQPFSNFFG